MATLSLPCAESEAQRVPLLVRARDGGSGGARAASGSLGPSSRRSLSVAATLVTALVVGAVVAVARGDAAGVATSFGGYAFPGAALGEGVGDAATNARGAGGVSPSPNSDETCKIGYYYHIPKTGGGSLVRYFGHLPEVELLRYEATIHVPKENKTLWYWEHQSSEDHWEKFVVPQALKPGKTLIAHHWGRFGMLGMEKRLRRLRERAEAKGCQFMASTTFREPIERDVSDEVFHRITGTGSARYLGDEQLRFFLLNSQRENARLPPDMAAREDVARDALDTAERILANHFDLVATIDDLELQKNAFLAFFDAKSPKKPDHRVAVGAGADGDAVVRLFWRFRVEKGEERVLLQLEVVDGGHQVEVVREDALGGVQRVARDVFPRRHVWRQPRVFPLRVEQEKAQLLVAQVPRGPRPRDAVEHLVAHVSFDRLAERGAGHELAPLRLRAFAQPS